MTDDTGSVSCWLDQLRDDDDRVVADAARRLWERYGKQLQDVTRRNLSSQVRRVADEEDIAQSAFRSFFRRLRDGQFDLHDRDALWGLLARIALSKARRRAEYHFAAKRGRGQVLDEAGLDVDMDALLGPEPGPAQLAQWDDFQNRLLELLGEPELKAVALLKLAGYTEAEIAVQVDRTERTVRRRLALIRRLWERELQRDSE
jgi:DNA-directed RNA polymerase specialized sigma24 family protein